MTERTNTPGLTFDRDTHEYFYHGAPVVSVTQVLQDLHRTQYFGDNAANRGTLVHEAIRLHTQGNLIMDKVPEEARGYLSGYLSASSALGDGLPEQVVFCPQKRYCGTVDRLGEEWITDYKTGAPSWWHPYQTAAYEQAVGCKRKRRCLYLAKDGSYKFVVHKDSTDVLHFNAALDGMHLRRKYNVG